jgi:metal transporter CNNM
VGLLFVKDLIFIDPGDETRVSDFIDIFGRGVHVVWPDDKLGDVLRELKLGRSHMALVRDVNKQDDSQDPFYEVRGIITLEDIIEEILGKSTARGCRIETNVDANGLANENPCPG